MIQAKEIKAPKGVKILSEGEPHTSAYLILSGRVEVYKESHGRRITLARLGSGQFFGEMNLVLESSRTASVEALEDCVLRVITQATFNRMLRKDPKSVFPLLRNLFERLRVMNTKYLHAIEGELTANDVSKPVKPVSKSAPLPPRKPPVPKPSARKSAPKAMPKTALKPTKVGLPAGTLILIGETEEARKITGNGGLKVKQFPFRIGRRTSTAALDVFQLNDLLLPDRAPYQVSRNHCLIDVAPDGGYQVQDRGSRLGTIVNGKKLGRNIRLESPLDRWKNTIVLGNPGSPYRFRLVFKEPV